ncbi:DJ-1/PfpI family protein [Streptomyces goshikiensis]|uniref:DJ-1/PfpI family protein n=1 Tax=Streptomyces goshikiensis TaxID=1942 RepID=UPI003721BAC8
MSLRNVLVVLYDGMQSLDVTGPVETFAALDHFGGRSGYRIRTVSPGGTPVRTHSGLTLVPDGDPEGARPAPGTTLPVPGGRYTADFEPRLTDWLRAHGSGAERLVAVCTGALLLAAAGLLDGRRAASHRMFLDRLPAFGAEPTGERVVFDGKYVTAAGVSSGIDMGLALLGRIAGDEVAQTVQLMTEYDPRPPSDAGSPDKAPADLVARLRAVSPP